MAKNVLSRRSFLGLAAGAVSGAVLAGCATPTPEVIRETIIETVVVETEGEEKIVEVEVEVTSVPDPSQEQIELLWWCGWPGPYMQAIAKSFEDQRPNIRLELGLFYIEGRQLLAAIAGGNAPDLVEDIPYLETIARDVILPIDDLVAGSDRISFDDGDIAKASFEAFFWQGQHYGVPSCDIAGREGMGFNLDVIDAAGLDVDNLPTTWEEVFDWHQQITTYDSAGNLDVLGMDPMAERTDACSFGDPWMWPHMWGFEYISDDLVYDIDRPETVEFLNVIKMFSDDVGVEKLDGMSTAYAGVSRGAFGVGRVAMRITYPSGPGDIWNVNPSDTYKFTYVPVPESRKGTTIQTAQGHAGLITKDTKYAEESFDLAVFLTEKEASDILYGYIGWLGPRKSWRDAADLSKYPEYVQENILYFIDSLDEADETWISRDPIEGITQTAWQDAYQAVQYGDLTPEEAAKKMQDDLTKELNQFLEERG